MAQQRDVQQQNASATDRILRASSAYEGVDHYVMNRSLRFFLAAAVLVTAASAPAAEAVQVTAASVYLLMSPSGEFSEDVAALQGFSSWNFAPSVPLGQSDQQFHSYLVKVRLKASKGAFIKGNVATIAIRRRADHRTLYEAKIANQYFPGGEAIVARMVDDLVCEPVTLVVSAGASRVSKDLDFRCGE